MCNTKQELDELKRAYNDLNERVTTLEHQLTVALSALAELTDREASKTNPDVRIQERPKA